MKIVFACDHGGFPFRAQILSYLQSHGHTVTDVGPDSLEPLDDFPDYADMACEVIGSRLAERGILVCGTGIGMSIAANRCDGIRAVLAYSPEIAKIGRSHNDANVICFGARTMDIDTVIASLDVFFATPFLGGKYKARNEMMDDMF